MSSLHSFTYFLLNYLLGVGGGLFDENFVERDCDNTVDLEEVDETPKDKNTKPLAGYDLVFLFLIRSCVRTDTHGRWAEGTVTDRHRMEKVIPHPKKNFD